MTTPKRGALISPQFRDHEAEEIARARQAEAERYSLRLAVRGWRKKREKVVEPDGTLTWCPPCPDFLGSGQYCRRCGWELRDHG